MAWKRPRQPPIEVVCQHCFGVVFAHRHLSECKLCAKPLPYYVHGGEWYGGDGSWKDVDESQGVPGLVDDNGNESVTAGRPWSEHPAVLKLVTIFKSDPTVGPLGEALLDFCKGVRISQKAASDAKPPEEPENLNDKSKRVLSALRATTKTLTDVSEKRNRLKRELKDLDTKRANKAQELETTEADVRVAITAHDKAKIEHDDLQRVEGGLEAQTETEVDGCKDEMDLEFEGDDETASAAWAQPEVQSAKRVLKQTLVEAKRRCSEAATARAAAENTPVEGGAAEGGYVDPCVSSSIGDIVGALRTAREQADMAANLAAARETEAPEKAL